MIGINYLIIMPSACGFVLLLPLAVCQLPFLLPDASPLLFTVVYVAVIQLFPSENIINVNVMFAYLFFIVN